MYRLQGSSYRGPRAPWSLSVRGLRCGAELGDGLAGALLLALVAQLHGQVESRTVQAYGLAEVSHGRRHLGQAVERLGLASPVAEEPIQLQRLLVMAAR